MTDYLSILAGVAGGVFGPWLVSVATVILMAATFVHALFSGSREADDPWWGVLLSWVALVLVGVGGIALLIFIAQFSPFAWAQVS